MPQPDGGVLVRYFARHETPSAVVRRYEANGALDSDFETMTSAPRPRAVQSDGKVIRAERASIGYRLVRVNPDGSHDDTFGSEGNSESVPFPISDIVLVPSGRILVSGSEFLPAMHGGHSITKGYLARFEPNGSKDVGFGDTGVVNLRAEFEIEARPVSMIAGTGETVTVAVREDERESKIVRLSPNGELDRTFGEAGLVDPEAEVFALHRLSDGKTLAAGTKHGATIRGRIDASDLFLARYQENGKPDPNFGGGGMALADSGGADTAVAVLWGADGSAMIGGYATALTATCPALVPLCREEPAIVRFNPSGVLDRGFGDGGISLLDAVAAEADGGEVSALAARPEGGVFATIDSDTAAFLAALTPAGNLDPDFGRNGLVTERNPTESSAAVTSVAVDRSGRILLAGRGNAGAAVGPPDGVVVRLRPTGALDRSFGGGEGYVHLPFSAEAISADLRGRPLVQTGSTIFRFTPGGLVDTPFGTEGLVMVGRGWDPRPQVATFEVLARGALLAVGEWRQGAAVIRLRPDGSLSALFGAGGMARIGFGGRHSCRALDVAVQPDQRILIAGRCTGPPKRTRTGTLSPEAMILARLLPRGAPDWSFGRRGRLVLRIGPRSRATGIALQGGKILVAGRVRRGESRADLLIRLRRNGALDRGFARRGVAVVPVGARSPHPDETVQILPAARRLLLVRAGRGWPVLAFRRNGRRDRLFARRPSIAPHRVFSTYLPPGPVAARQRRRLVLAWTTRAPNDQVGTHRVIAVQRLRNR